MCHALPLPIRLLRVCFVFFFFNVPATTEIYTLSLHDALPICASSRSTAPPPADWPAMVTRVGSPPNAAMFCCTHSRAASRSEEHTSELQSHVNLVCRLLLEKKKL